MIFEMNRRKLRLNRRIWGMNPRKFGMVDVNCSICKADYIGSCNDKVCTELWIMSSTGDRNEFE